MGGRGASSSSNSRVSASEREAYERYVQERLNNKEYMRANRPGEFSIKYPEEFARDFANSRKTYTFDNRNNIINALKEQTNVDLSKAIDDNRFSTKSRTYFDVDSRKLNQNEFNTMMKYLKYDNDVRIESNGAYHYSIYYKKSRR